MASSRQFDIILLGPTGYTGKWCAEHIVQYLPTDLKWALAGRSLQKIEGVAADLKKLNPDRIAPGESMRILHLGSMFLRANSDINKTFIQRSLLFSLRLRNLDL